MEVNNDTLITKSDRTRKCEFRKTFFFPKRQNNGEKLNTPFYAKFPTAIFKNPYYTPCNTAHTLLHSPCNTDQVITLLGDMTCCISNLSHMQN